MARIFQRLHWNLSQCPKWKGDPMRGSLGVSVSPARSWRDGSALAPGPAPAAPTKGSREAQSWAGQGSPKDPMQGSGGWQEAGCVAHRVATVPELPAAPRRPRPPSTKAGQVKSVTEEPPRSPSKHQPSWAGWCKGWENVTGESLCCST